MLFPSNFESHPGGGVPEACGVLSASLAFAEAVQGLDAGCPSQESSGTEITEGSLSWEVTDEKRLREMKLVTKVFHLVAGTAN